MNTKSTTYVNYSELFEGLPELDRFYKITNQYVKDNKGSLVKPNDILKHFTDRLYTERPGGICDQFRTLKKRIEDRGSFDFVDLSS